MRAFEPGRALALIEEQRPTVTLMVPTMIQALLAHADIDTRDLSSLRCLNYAGEPITRPVMVRAMRRFGPVLYQLYAQSEAITITMLQPHEHPLDDEAGGQHSVGRATPNVTLRIVDENGEPVPRGSIGEVAVQAPGQMTELWNDPEATRARLLPDGSLLTRDMGYLDEDGFLYIVDRKEDMIISGGHNIWPAELENVIASYAGVREVCVLGVPHEKWGETPRAFVVADDGTVVDEDNLIAFTRERVGPIKKVTSVRVVDALPTSGVGKVLRRAVRERYRDEAPMHLEGA
jgi:acyl-CoA synthetase (AMP-forming)/AMP-acid ligase II